jgi:hypothetical protein
MKDIQALGGLGKDEKNQAQKYSFRGIDGLMNFINPLLGKHDVIVAPRVKDMQLLDRQNNKGGSVKYVYLTVDYDFISAADGSVYTATTVGEAMDFGDKAANKAMSAAYKYACFQAFCIPTQGEMVDSERYDEDGYSDQQNQQHNNYQQQGNHQNQNRRNNQRSNNNRNNYQRGQRNYQQQQNNYQDSYQHDQHQNNHYQNDQHQGQYEPQQQYSEPPQPEQTHQHEPVANGKSQLAIDMINELWKVANQGRAAFHKLWNEFPVEAREEVKADSKLMESFKATVDKSDVAEGNT